MRALSVILILVLAMGACKKYQCEQSVVQIGVRIGFVGFSADQLDTVYIEGNDNYGIPVTDAVYSPKCTVINDTAYMDSSFHSDFNVAFMMIKGDHTITVPGANKVFLVNNMHWYSYPTWKQKTPCTGGQKYTPIESPDSVSINGIRTVPSWSYHLGPSAIVFLHH